MIVRFMMLMMTLVNRHAHKAAGVAVFIIPIDGDGRVTDIEALLERALDGPNDKANIGPRRRPHMHRSERISRGDEPNMRMAYGLDALDVLDEIALDILRHGVIGRALKEDMKRAAEELPGAPQDEQRHKNREDRIDRRPIRQVDDEGRDDRAC